MRQIRTNNGRNRVGLKFALATLLAAVVFTTVFTMMSVSAGVTIGDEDQQVFFTGNEGKVTIPLTGAEDGQVLAVFREGGLSQDGTSMTYELLAHAAIANGKAEVVSSEFVSALDGGRKSFYVAVLQKGAEASVFDGKTYDEMKSDANVILPPQLAEISTDITGPSLVSSSLKLSYGEEGKTTVQYSDYFYMEFQLTDEAEKNAVSGFSENAVDSSGKGVTLERLGTRVTAVSVEARTDENGGIVFRAKFPVWKFVDENNTVPIRFNNCSLEVTAADNLNNQKTSNASLTSGNRELQYNRNPVVSAQYSIYRNGVPLESKYANSGDELVVTLASDKQLTGFNSARIGNVVLPMDTMENLEVGLKYDAEKDFTYQTYTIRFTFEEKDWRDQQSVSVTVNVREVTGVWYTYGEDTGLTYYDSLETTGHSVTADGQAQRETFYVRSGQTLVYTLHTNHAADVFHASIAGGKVDSITSNEERTTHTLTYTLDSSKLKDFEGLPLPLEIILEDAAQGRTTVTESNFASAVYYGDITVTKLDFYSDNPNDTQIAKNGDTVTLTIQTNHEVRVQNATLNGRKFRYSTDASKELTLTYTLSANDNIQDFSFLDFTVELTDAARNTVSISTADLDSQQNIRYFGEISIGEENIKIFSSNSKSSSVAINGDTVTVEFITEHPIIIQSATIAGKEAVLTQQDDEGMSWKMEYVVENGCISDNSRFGFTINITDAAGNGPVDIQSQRTPYQGEVTYYAPIVVSEVKFSTDNKATPSLAKDGDTLTLRFKTTHPVEVTEASIAGKSVTFTSNDQMNWTAAYKIGNGEVSDNAVIGFSFSVSDAAGNQAVNKNEDSLGYEVRYYAPIAIKNLKFISNNVNGSNLAKDGNTVSLSFTTTHPILVSNGNIAGNNVKFTSEDGMNWKASYTIQSGSIVDQNAVTFTFKADDDAGNDAVTTNNFQMNRQIIYYAPIQITNTKIESSNAVDGTKYAKNADTITVSFTSNHPVTVTNANIAGNAVVFESSNGTDWTARYTVRNEDISDQDWITFQFTANDAAGNDPVTKDYQNEDVANEIRYYAPIRANSSIHSSGKNQRYAKNGDRLIVSIEANHNVYVQSALLLGREVQVSNSEGIHLTTEYTIPENESLLAEGNVAFQIVVMDAAGNSIPLTEASDGTKVTYDRTAPTAKLSPIFNGYTGQAFTVNVYLEDENLDPNGMSIMLNGENTVNDADKSAIVSGKKDYTKTISITEENEYDLSVAVTDLAGNQSAPGVTMKAILDQTDPKFKTISIDLGKPMAFKSGFVLSEYIEIDEKYVRDVSCQITDSQGVADWDMDEPIVTEGKKTVNIMVQDMAGNSGFLNYDFYIDGTAPKINVLDATSNTEVAPYIDTNTFYNDMVLSISLSELHIGSEEPDRFNMIQLYDEAGFLITDILSSEPIDENGIYNLAIPEKQSYMLLVEAVDDVGNVTYTEYFFTVGQKGVLQVFYENKAVFYITIAALAVLIACAAVGIALYLKKKKAKKRWF